MGRPPRKSQGKERRRTAQPAAQRRRVTPRRRNRTGLVALLAAMVTIGLLAAYGPMFLATRFGPQSPPIGHAGVHNGKAAGPVQPDRSPETPPLERAVVEAGYDRDRIGTLDGSLYVETFDPPEVVAHKIRVANPALSTTATGDEVRVTGGGALERRRVVELERDSEADGFVEAEPSAPSYVPEPETTAPAGAKRIVLILDDVGFENQPIDDASAIDAPITFAVIPTAPKATQAATLLNARGFEILCHLPMEPLDYPRQSPGPEAILVSLSDEEIRTRTRVGLRAVPNAVGVNNHMGSRATRDRRVMENVAAVLREEGVFFIDSRTAGNSLAASVVGAGAVPVASRDVFLDDDPREASVRRQLRELVRLADRKEYAVGIGHVYPATVRVLREEIPKLKELGYTFHFARDVVRRTAQLPPKIAASPSAPKAVLAP
ncbi:MAG: divergent polysaccharide deacetylase family protein [Acidobacteria bacterium]|nr:divergent polysaccharide deacetylase family protein [Acidobacteriota bacterium]